MHALAIPVALLFNLSDDTHIFRDSMFILIDVVFFKASDIIRQRKQPIRNSEIS
jgi:hypothetical protein